MKCWNGCVITIREKFIFLYNAAVGLYAVSVGACYAHNATRAAQSVCCLSNYICISMFINVNK